MISGGFLLTRLLRGVTINCAVALLDRSFLLTRLLRGVTDSCYKTDSYIVISTHTPLARRDKIKMVGDCRPPISTHTPLARRDSMVYKTDDFRRISTHTPLARRDPRLIHFGETNI